MERAEPAKRHSFVLGLAIVATSVVLAAAGPASDTQGPGNGRSKAGKEIAASEYEVAWQTPTMLADVDAAWHAPNRTQSFRTYFTEGGIRVVPLKEEKPGWQWGLALIGYGRGGELWPATGAALSPAGNRIDYRRGGFDEWYVNSPEGLEQSFILPAPPEEIASQAGAASSPAAPPRRGRRIVGRDPVRLDLKLLGDLQPIVSADGQAIDFVRPGGPAAIHFAQLKVTDARGRELPAWMEGLAPSPGRRILIVIDDTDAVYPITVDPLATSPGWTVHGDPGSAQPGGSVATAGDVNGSQSSGAIGRTMYDNNGTILDGAPGQLLPVDPNASDTFLPLAGGTMTGPITTAADGATIVLPPGGGTAGQTAIEFQSEGDVYNPSWYVYNTNFPKTGWESGDHVLTFGYNYFKGDRMISGEHAIRFGYESGYGPHGGNELFEWNLDIDPNADAGAVAGPLGAMTRPWFFYYTIDKRQTSLQVGPLPTDADPNTAGWQASDPNDFYMAMNRRGASGFEFAGRGSVDTSAKATFTDMNRALLWDSDHGDPGDPLTQSRIVIDPAGTNVRNGFTDRAVFLSALGGAGSFDLEPGLQPDGTTRGSIYFGLYRPTTVTIGGQLVASNLGTEYRESEINPACSSGNYSIYADASEAKMKVCQNGTRRDMLGSFGSGTLDFDFTGEADQGTCQAAQTITVIGAAVNDIVDYGIPNASVIAGVTWTVWVSAPDTVSVQPCCVTAADCADTPAGTWNVRTMAP